MEEIAARAGVSKPVVYEHFGGKDGLYQEVVRREMARLVGRVALVCAVTADQPFWGERVRALGVGAAVRLSSFTDDDARAGTQRLSARTGAGLDAVRAELQRRLGTESAGEGAFTARQRHVDALRAAAVALDDAAATLRGEALEPTAEALRAAHDAIGAITGRVGADDLLGHIFSSFCIGK